MSGVCNSSIVECVTQSNICVHVKVLPRRSKRRKLLQPWETPSGTNKKWSNSATPAVPWVAHIVRWPTRRQAVNEYHGMVFLGDKPPDMLNVVNICTTLEKTNAIYLGFTDGVVGTIGRR